MSFPSYDAHQTSWNHIPNIWFTHPIPPINHNINHSHPSVQIQANKVTWLNCWYLNHVRCHLNWKLINLYFGIEEKCWFTVFSLFLHLIPCHINPTPTPQPHPWPEILKPTTSNPKNHSHARGPNHPITITTLLPKQHKSHKIPQNTELSLTHTHSSTKMA